MSASFRQIRPSTTPGATHLVDLDDLYNKCEPAEQRILNRALFTRITIDDEENATYTPDETTASVLAHTNIDPPTEVTAETN